MMEFLLLSLYTISFVIFWKIILIAYTCYITRKKFCHIPGPTAYPILGSAPLLYSMGNEDRMKYILSLSNQFKDGLFVIWLAQQPIVYVYKPEIFQRILSGTTNIMKAKRYDFLKSWLGNGLLTAPVKQWHRHRKLIQPAFSFTIMEQFAVTMSRKTEVMLKCFEKEVAENPTKAIDIIPFIGKIAINILLETVMGVDVDNEETVSMYMKNVYRYLYLQMQRVYTPLLSMDWIYYLSSKGRQQKEIVHNLHKFTNEVIWKKKLARNMQNNKPEDTQIDSDTLVSRKRKALLDLLLDLNDSNSIPLTDEEIREQIDTFMFGGHDTTKTAIIWALFCIGNNPKYQEKIHEELEKVFKDSRKPATVKELLQLNYLERVMKEANRIYPSIPKIMRQLSEDIKMDNYTIPKDSSVILGILLLHRNPAIWPDPLKFDPDRFLPENVKLRHPYAYIPFSAGVRNCIGKKFAEIEEKIVLTAILRKWRVKSVETPEEITLQDLTVLESSHESIHLHFLPKE